MYYTEIYIVLNLFVYLFTKGGLQQTKKAPSPSFLPFEVFETFEGKTFRL